MLIDDNTNVRVVRRSYGGGWLPLAFALCCCCTIVLVGIALIVGFAFTGNNGDGNGGGLFRTRTTNHRITTRAHGRFSPLQELTQCSGFLDIANSEQLQVGPQCAVGLTGRCLAGGVCGGEFFGADRLSTEDGMGFECAVATSVCDEPDANDFCTCPSTQTTCRRDVQVGSTVTPTTFACVEPRTCTSFDDIALASQPAVVNAQCDQFRTEIAGRCSAAGPNAVCIVRVETVGALANDTLPAGQTTCTPSNVCTAPDADCGCFASACIRCIGGVNCNDQDNVVQFQCAPASQVPGGAPSIDGRGALLLSLAATLVFASGK